MLFLAAHTPSKIVFTGRKKAAADKVIAECKAAYPSIAVSFLPCDLASLAAVKDAAQSFIAENDSLDILLAVAGIMCVPPGFTKEGYEMHMGTNHIGHALLIKLLLPLLEKTASDLTSPDVRVVMYTSLAAQLPMAPGGGIAFDELRTKQDMFLLGGMRRYGQSKLANLLYARKLAELYPELTITSVHPGVAWTGLVDNTAFLTRMFIMATTYNQKKSSQEVAYNGCWAATAPLKGQAGADNRLGEVETGVYYEPVGIKGNLGGATGDDKLAQKLWEWTEKELARWKLDA